MQKLLLIDGNSLLHRAWHALPPLATKSGQVISGAYGFTMMLLNATRNLKPTHLAVAWDLPGPTWRHEEFPAYKAQREKKPQELYDQIPLIGKILEALKVPSFSLAGFEADDVIGSLAKQVAQKHGFEVVIATGDLDALQLVDWKINVFVFRRGVSQADWYDVAAVEKRFGFQPKILVDYKAMRGDASDNIPGVPGIGEKIATELLINFGNLENVYKAVRAHDSKISKSVREKLLTHEDKARLAYRLCEIKKDLKIDYAIKDLEYNEPSREQVEPIFKELEFTKLLGQFKSGLAPHGLSSSPAGGDPDNSQLDVVDPRCGEDDKIRGSVKKCLAIASREDLNKLFKEFETAKSLSFYSFKTELLVCFKKVVYVVSASFLKSEEIKLMFGSPIAKICFDLKREYTNFDTFGIKISQPIFDLMLGSFSLYAGERRQTFAAVMNMLASLNIEEINLESLSSALPRFDEIRKSLEKIMKVQGVSKVIEDIEIPLAHVLSKMEQAGVAVEVAYFKKLSKEIGLRLAALTKKIYKLAGGEFNINSPRQMSQILFGKMGIVPKGLKKTTKGGAISTAAGELEKLRQANPIIKELLEYRELTKLKSTYIDTITDLVDPKTSRVHSTFNQTGAATGRLSSSDPNLQNIPTTETEYGQKVRNGFVAKPGFMLVDADYSQFELRIAAHLANEKVMIEAFKNGEDIHLRTAQEMFGRDEAKDKRRIAKTINFGVLYGMGPQRLAASAGLTVDEARAFIDQYFAILPNISRYIEDVKAQVRQLGYVETLFGRKRFFRNLKVLDKREEAEAMRQAVNMPMQGTQADLVKMAMIDLDKYLEKCFGHDVESEARMIIQVHDEIVLEVKKNRVEEVVDHLKNILENVYQLKVPLVVNISTGTRWGEMKRIV